jgi:hypothetical protein
MPHLTVPALEGDLAGREAALAPRPAGPASAGSWPSNAVPDPRVKCQVGNTQGRRELY